MYELVRGAAQRNSHRALLARAPMPIRNEIAGCNPDNFDAEMNIFLLGVLAAGADQLPDDVWNKVSPRVDDLLTANLPGVNADDPLTCHMHARLLFYDRLTAPDMFDTVIEYAANQITASRPFGADPPLTLRTWLKTLATQIMAEERRLITSILGRQILDT